METKENSFNTRVSNRIINLLGIEVVELLQNSTTLSIYDIDNNVETNTKIITSTHFYGHKINEVIYEPTLSIQEDLKGFFLSLSSYNWAGVVASCIFEPGFAIAFGNSNGENLLNIFICFRCGKLLFQLEKGQKKNEVYFSGFDILLILFNEVFKDLEKVESAMTQLSMSYDSYKNDSF